MTIAEMQAKFGIPGSVTVAKGRGGIPALALSHASGAEAEVSLLGAHVTSWCTADGVDRLFLSRYAEFKPGGAIRGGVPVIFPQFANEGPFPKHGFARGAQWTIERTAVASDESVTVVLGLQDNLATRAVWPYSFRLELTVRLADTLTITLSCKNRDRERYSFTAALHSYFQVADAAQASVEGLKGLSYRDFGDNARGTELRDAVTIEGELDRAYVRAPREIVLRDNAAGHTLRIRQENMPDIVVWNPWAEKSKELPDMANEEYREMLCVETCAIAEPVLLRPGETWIGTTEFTADVPGTVVPESAPAAEVPVG